MFTRLNNTITNAIENAMNNSVCDFNNWWKDDFETDVYFETEEDFKNLSDTDLEIAKYDFVSWCLDGFVSEVCNLLGIEMYNTHSEYHEIILEEVHDIVKDMLFNRISTMKHLSMKHLVIFYTENGIYSAVYDFKNIPPTIEDIKEMQKDLQKMESLIQMPAIVNWLPISD